jgi:hypothetical protein
VNRLIHNRTLVDSLASAVRDGEAGLDDVPQMLRRVLEEGAWREFTTKLGEEVHHERFAEFVTTPPLAGLGASVALIRRIVADDKGALDLLDQALQNREGHPTVSNIHSRPAGTTEARALRKLRSDAPELHADVLAGRLSAHAAMVEAGFRPRTVSVPIGRPDTVAKTLRKHMTAADLARLAALLTEDQP